MNSKGLHEIPVARWFSSLKSEKAREVQKKTLKIKLSSIDEHNQNDGQNCFCKEILSKKSTSAFRLQIVFLGCPNQYCSRDSMCHSEKNPCFAGALRISNYHHIYPFWFITVIAVVVNSGLYLYPCRLISYVISVVSWS